MPADESLDYQDPATGHTYRVMYDYYTDPETVVIESVWLGGKRVRVPRELKARMRAAAMEAYLAAGQKLWQRLRHRSAPPE